MGGMLWAHWCYFGGGIIAILFVKEEENYMFVDSADDVAKRISMMTFSPGQLAESMEAIVEEIDEEDEDGASTPHKMVAVEM